MTHNDGNLKFFFRKNALEKLKAMIHFIGYPEALLDNKKLNDYYKNVSLRLIIPE